MSSAFNLVYEAEETEVMFKHLMSCGSRAIAFNTVYGEGHMSAHADCILILFLIQLSLTPYAMMDHGGRSWTVPQRGVFWFEGNIINNLAASFVCKIGVSVSNGRLNRLIKLN